MAEFQLKFFASLKEQLGQEALTLSTDEVPNTAALMPYLKAAHPSWAEHLDTSLLIALNHEVVFADMPIQKGDEVALLPPMTGG